MKDVRFLLCVLVGLGSLGADISRDGADASQGALDQLALARAEVKWQASKTHAYEFRFQHACNGLIPPPPPDAPPGVLFRVKDGESTIQRTGAGPAAVAPDLVQYSTVERLFAFIRTASARGPSRMEVQYDPARGYPTRVCVNPAAAVADDEFGFVVTEFKVLSPS